MRKTVSGFEVGEAQGKECGQPSGAQGLACGQQGNGTCKPTTEGPES